MTSATAWAVEAVEAVDSGHPDARALMPDYVGELSRRFYGRPVTEDELEYALAEHVGAELAPPDGVLLLARAADGTVCGCIGVRLLTPRVAEIKRLYVAPAGRGQGGGARLLAAAEEWAGSRGVRALRLDTRGDLVEARTLYTRHGFDEIPDYNGNPYAQHWYEKRLPPGPAGPLRRGRP
jgi:GNAT superfamily N-acetyltransferase